MNFSLVLALGLLLTFVSPAHASDDQSAYSEHNLELYDTYKSNAYTMTKQMCTPRTLKGTPYEYKLHSNNDADGFFAIGYEAGPEVTAQAEMIWNGFRHMYNDNTDLFLVTPELMGLLDSDDYYKALRECYGNDYDKWNDFTISLFAADNLGKFAALYLPVKATTYIATRIAQTKFFMQSPKLVSFIRKTYKTLTVTSFVLPPAALLALHYIKLHEAEVKENQTKELSTALDGVTSTVDQIEKNAITFLNLEIENSQNELKKPNADRAKINAKIEKLKFNIEQIKNTKD